jgi:hypothetical protein
MLVEERRWLNFVRLRLRLERFPGLESLWCPCRSDPITGGRRQLPDGCAFSGVSDHLERVRSLIDVFVLVTLLNAPFDWASLGLTRAPPAPPAGPAAQAILAKYPDVAARFPPLLRPSNPRNVRLVSSRRVFYLPGAPAARGGKAR